MERAGPIEISLDGIMIILWGDLLSIFKPIDLWLWIPSDSACESYRHAFKDLVMFQLHLKEWRHSIFHRHVPILSFIPRFIHWRPF